MPYSAEISRANPSCFLFLIDQSGSMEEPIGAGDKKKSHVVADTLNRALQTLILRCAKAEGIRDYFHIGVIGYGGKVAPALGAKSGTSAADVAAGVAGLMPLSVVANAPLRVEERTTYVDDGIGGVTEKRVRFPVWVEPRAQGPTPMCEALDSASRILDAFLSRYPRCHPPVLMNITDGKATDGKPRSHVSRIHELHSEDGPPLVLNLHLSSRPEAPIMFPDAEAGLPDDFARSLFRMSSVLPSPMVQNARREGFSASDQSRGFAFNADLVSLVRFLNIGTRVDPKNLR